MTTRGVDYYAWRPGLGAALQGAGVSFACRYLGGSSRKDMTAGEAADLHGHRVGTVTNFESSAASELGGASAGAQEGAAAGGQARALGQPAGRPIYYSADFDALGWETTEIVAYLTAAQRASGYPAGSYGGYGTIAAAYAAGFRWLWQTLAWSGGKVHPAALIYQSAIGNVYFDGVQCDTDEGIAADVGQWGTGSPVSPPPSQVISAPQLVDSGGHPINAAEVGVALTPSGKGYWLAGADGGVFTFGDAIFRGSEGGSRLNASIVGMAASGSGYWLVGSDGGIFTFGTPFCGSEGGHRLNKPIVGMAASRSGHGYWLVASDGGIFAFGDAVFHGSAGGRNLTAPIVGMAADAVSGGYWLVGSDGGVFSYNASFHGSMGGIKLNKPMVGMAARPQGDGYWLVASDGGIFNYGAAVFHGSMGGQPLHSPVTSIASTPSGNGYVLSAADYGIFTFGDAVFAGAGA